MEQLVTEKDNLLFLNRIFLDYLKME